MQRDRRRGPGAAVRRVRRAGAPAPAANGRRRAAARRRRPGPKPSSSPSRRKRSASTGAAIRSIAMPADLKEFRRAIDRRARRRAGQRSARRRLGARRPQADRARHQHRRHRRRLPAAQDAQRAIAWRSSRSRTRRAASKVVVFPEAFQRSGGLIETGTLVLVRGKLERDDESVRILASEIVADRQRPRAAGARGRDSPEDAGRPRRVRGARRDFFPPPRRPDACRSRSKPGEPPNRLRVKADVSLADPRAAVAGAHRGSRAGRRAGIGVAAMIVTTLFVSVRPIAAPETLEFEEPIAVLLKEIEALTLLPRTDARDREIDALRRRIESVRAELYAIAHAVAARAGRAPSRTVPASRTSSSACSPASSRSTATAASPTTTRS